jgi:hypothetical protein
MADILTKTLPKETLLRCIADALSPDDILPPLAQNTKDLLNMERNPYLEILGFASNYKRD